MDFEVKEDQALTAQLKARQPKPSYHFENILNGLDVNSDYKHKKQFAKCKYYLLLKQYFSTLEIFATHFYYPKNWSSSEPRRLRINVVNFLAQAYAFTHPRVKHHPIFDSRSDKLQLNEDAASEVFSQLLQMQDLVIRARYGSTDYLNSKEDNSKLTAALIKLFSTVQQNTY